MRVKFEEQLALLNKEIISMGALCEEAISLVEKALSASNISITEKVRVLEDEIDQTEHFIESLCLKLILQQQPVAHDLRYISAALKMITDMERIGDQAADIAEIIPYLGDRRGKDLVYISDMAHETMSMVTKSVDAFVKNDAEIAYTVIIQDDVVDDLFTKVKSSLIDMISMNAADGGYALDLLMIAKYFERIGDHATNIAEWVLFSISGEHKSLQ